MLGIENVFKPFSKSALLPLGLTAAPADKGFQMEVFRMSFELSTVVNIFDNLKQQFEDIVEIVKFI